MNNPRWAVGLQGELFDLEDARELFGRSSSFCVAEIQVPNRNITALIADEFDEYEAAATVNEAAQRLVTLINGYLFARDTDRSPLQASTIHSRDANGQWGPGTVFASVEVQAGRLRARGHAVVVHADGTTSPDEHQVSPEIVWLNTTMDDTAMDVLHMLRGDPDWFDLFMAFERMRDDLNRRLPKKSKPSVIGWPDTNHFSQSSQVYRHSRVKWTSGYNPETSMSLREAQAFVARLVRSWLQWRASNHPY